MNDNYMKTILSGVKEWTENLTDDAIDKANNAIDKANNALEQANKSIDKALFVVNVRRKSGSTFSADKTYDEIFQAYNEGKYNIVAVYNSLIFPLVLCSVEHGLAAFSMIWDGSYAEFLINPNNEVIRTQVLLATTKSKLPNPYPLTFTGAVSETYDGSSAKTIEIPIGADGITPTIGDNGNWYLGATDTGKPSRGEKGDTGANGPQGPKGDTGATGADGKSAYSYAQDGGYTGTEAEFAAKLAAEKLPNPYPLTFTGAVSATYDGSSAKTIEVPSGGGGASGLCIYDNYDVTLISFAQIDQATLPIDAGIVITADDNGNSFSYDGVVVWTDIKSSVSYTDIDFNNVSNVHYPIQHGVKDSMNMYVVDGTSMRAIVGDKSCVYIRQTRDDVNAVFFPASNIARLPEKITAIHLCPRNKVVSGTFYKIWGLTKK